MKIIAVILLLICLDPAFSVEYLPLKEEYVRLTALTIIEGPLEPRRDSKNLATGWRVELVRTDGGTVPYDKEVALIQVFDESDHRRGGLIVNGFKDVSAQWLDDRRLFISVWTGRFAEVIALYDAVADKIFYQTLVSYWDQSPGSKPPAEGE